MAMLFKRKETMDVVELVGGQQSGRRSAMAAAAARRAGLDVRNVSGGMTAWERHGLNTTTPGRNR